MGWWKRAWHGLCWGTPTPTSAAIHTGPERPRGAVPSGFRTKVWLVCELQVSPLLCSSKAEPCTEIPSSLLRGAGVSGLRVRGSRGWWEECGSESQEPGVRVPLCHPQDFSSGLSSLICKMGQSCCFEELLALGSPLRTDAGAPHGQAEPRKGQGLGLWGPPQAAWDGEVNARGLPNCPEAMRLLACSQSWVGARPDPAASRNASRGWAQTHTYTETWGSRNRHAVPVYQVGVQTEQ